MMMADEQPTTTSLWEELETIIASGDAKHLAEFLRVLPPEETAYTISHLEEDDQTRLLELLSPDLSADLMEFLSDEQAADLIEDLPVETAAAIVDEMESDDAADVLIELDEEDAEAILERMPAEEAAEVRRLASYEWNTAGGLIVTEYLSYPATNRVDEVLADLRQRQEEYAEYIVTYVYVTGEVGELVGVVRFRDLVLAPSHQPLDKLMIPAPRSLHVDAGLQEMETFFDYHDFYAAPVVDDDGVLLGAVRRDAVEELHTEEADIALMRFGGIVFGEELRSMPLMSRALPRLLFLAATVLLGLVSISVIAKYEHIVEKVAALAVFLPLVAGLCGSAGNQAVAVSMRELSMGIVRPRDAMMVFGKELAVGGFNGVLLGLLVFAIVWIWAGLAGWPGGPYLALSIAVAIPLTMIVAVILGGVTPLMLKGVGLDPAMVSGPIITTVVDLFGFFAVLTAAAMMIAQLT